MIERAKLSVNWGTVEWTNRPDVQNALAILERETQIPSKVLDSVAD